MPLILDLENEMWPSKTVAIKSPKRNQREGNKQNKKYFKREIYISKLCSRLCGILLICLEPLQKIFRTAENQESGKKERRSAEEYLLTIIC